MKHRISELYDTYADKLVEFSKIHGAKSWIVFLFIFAFIMVTTGSGWTLDYPEFPETRNNITAAHPRLLSDTEVIHGVAGEQGARSRGDHVTPLNATWAQLDNCHQDQEVRGVWLTNVDSDVLFSAENTTNAIATLAELNFNTLYPTVWNWGYTLYPSPVAQQVTGIDLDPTPGLQNRDVLQEIVDQGHQKGMAVIPWFEFGFMAPADSQLAKLHPEWLTQRANGSTIWLEGKVHERVWLNPLHPEVQQFITDLIVELVSNYDVDGIQLDDHFGYPSELGYDDYTVALYQQEHAGKSPPQNAKDPAWIQWRADKITNYMSELFKAIKQANPQAIVSLSPNPQGFSLKSFLLDWQTWERKGLIEELIVQIYRDNNNVFITELSKPEIIAAKAHIPVSIGILSGLKGRNVLFGRIRQQVDITRKRNFAGVSFFFYESLWNMSWESPAIRKTNLISLFKTPAERVDLACKQ